MSRAGARASRAERRRRELAALEAAPRHPSPRCPKRSENWARIAEGDRPYIACTCAWDLAQAI